MSESFDQNYSVDYTSSSPSIVNPLSISMPPAAAAGGTAASSSPSPSVSPSFVNPRLSTNSISLPRMSNFNISKKQFTDFGFDFECQSERDSSTVQELPYKIDAIDLPLRDNDGSVHSTLFAPRVTNYPLNLMSVFIADRSF